jgi:protocatechuate 3,4-dioxygenase beta subunit
MTNLFSRRRALAAFGGVGLGTLLAGCGGDDDGSSSGTTTTTADGTQTTTEAGLADLFATAASCTVAPGQTEGPFYFDVDSVRSDIREDREGVPLRLALRVLDADCAPVADSVVDIWHCDASGTYSGFEAASTGPGGGGGRTDDETYLRGAQVTNGEGIVRFVTIYPGWYPGRTVHVHAKVHLDNTTALTTQLYFDEDVTARVYEREPYASDPGPVTSNADDGIFAEANVLTTSEEGDGYLGVMTFTLSS